jgi:hypothetical protein
MPATRFFALRADLEPALMAIESLRELKYIPYDGTPSPPVYHSIRDIPPEIFAANNFLITERYIPTVVMPEEYTAKDAEPEYEVQVEKGKPSVFFAPSKLGSSETAKFVVGGSIETSDDLRYTFEEHAFYREFALALQRHLTQKVIDHLSIAYLYGAEAIQLGKSGRDYYVEVPATTIVDYSAWSEENREENQRSQQFPARTARLSHEETWAQLNVRGYGWKYEDEDDSPSNVFHFSRTTIYGEAFDHFTLPKSHFYKTLLEFTSFCGTDLSQSDIHESDVLDCDFSGADLRQSKFFCVCYCCSFVRADLRGADLRGAPLVQCDFTDALMQGTKLLYEQETLLNLSEQQRSEIEWHDEADENEEYDEDEDEDG